MKTYREMTESVLEKAGTEIRKKERRRRNGVFIAASGLCFALVLTVLGMGMEQPPAVLPTLSGEQPGLSADATDAPQPTQRAEVKITYLTNIEGQRTVEPVSADVIMPLGIMARIRDTRGLTEEEADKALMEELDIVDKFRMSNRGSTTKYQYPEVITINATDGFLTLDFSHCAVTNVDFKVDGIGGVGWSGKLYGPKPDGCTETYWPNVQELYLKWTFSGEFVLALREDPTFPLESIHDTVTVTIDYANGTAETIIFDITANEEGYIFVTQRGIPTLAA